MILICLVQVISGTSLMTTQLKGTKVMENDKYFLVDFEKGLKKKNLKLTIDGNKTFVNRDDCVGR